MSELQPKNGGACIARAGHGVLTGDRVVYEAVIGRTLNIPVVYIDGEEKANLHERLDAICYSLDEPDSERKLRALDRACMCMMQTQSGMEVFGALMPIFATGFVTAGTVFAHYMYNSERAGQPQPGGTYVVPILDWTAHLFGLSEEDGMSTGALIGGQV